MLGSAHAPIDRAFALVGVLQDRLHRGISTCTGWLGIALVGVLQDEFSGVPLQDEHHQARPAFTP